MQKVFPYAIKQPHSLVYENYSGNSTKKEVDQRVQNRPILQLLTEGKNQYKKGFKEGH